MSVVGRRVSFWIIFPFALAALRLSAATAGAVIPAAAPHGAHVVISGAGLDAPDMTVTFSSPGGTPLTATILAREPRLLDAVVPEGAATGPLIVRTGAASIATFFFTLLPDSVFTSVGTLAASDQAHGVFKAPAAVAVDPSGAVYVADTGHGQIKLISPLTAVSVLASGFKEPIGLAFDAARSVLYVADRGDHVVKRIGADHVITLLAGSGRVGDADGVGMQASFSAPAGLALDWQGNLYVADSGNHKIRRITPEGAVTTIAGRGTPGLADGPPLQASFHTPEGVAVSSSGSIYVADTLNHVIRRIEAGAVTTVAGTSHPGFIDGPPAAAEFHEPTGLTIGDGGMLYVADRLNHAIRKVAVDGSVSTAAGTGTPGYANGQLQAAIFNQPAAVIFAGALFVADAQNDALRIVYPQLRVAAVYPAIGPMAGGNAVRVLGTGFVPGATQVSFGGLPASLTFVSSTELIAVVPTGEGTVDVTVHTAAGSESLAAAYTYLPPPSIIAVQPRKLATAGGQLLTITGTNFVGDVLVTLAGTGAERFTIINSATLTGTSPASAAGPADLNLTTAGGSATLSPAVLYFAPPTITGFAPLKGFAGMLVTVDGSGFDPDTSGDAASFGSASAPIVSASATQLVVRVPDGAVTSRISLTTAGGSAQSVSSFVVPVLASIAVTPQAPTLTIGATLQLSATGTYSDGTTVDLTTAVQWSSSDPAAAVSASGLVSGIAAGTTTVTATKGGVSGSTTISIAAAGPTLRPSTIDPTVATSFKDSIRFLYSGTSAVQLGVTPGAIDERRVSVIRGRVLDRSGSVLAGVRLSVLGSSQTGYTSSRSDGWFDLAVNGGGPVLLAYEKSGFLSVQREIRAGWNRYATAPDVVMVPVDAQVTAIDSSGTAATQVARSTTATDADGTRRATLLFPAGLSATMRLPDGTQQALPSMHVRATEYTVGANGPQSMPASLPPQSGYTYCVELTADEALQAGADTVTFSAPVPLYVENFLGFPVGEGVPVGFYDRRRGVWMAMQNGRIVKILNVSGADVALDLDGDGLADDATALAALGITAEERAQLASLYTAGQTLWRVALPHFTAVDHNWPVGPALPESATPPDQPEPTTDANPDDCCRISGSIIECESQALGQALPITGTSFSLHYESARVPGRIAARTAEISLSGATLSQDLLRIDLAIDVAGQHITKSFTPAPNLKETFTWDGKDVYGRTLQGAQDARIDLAYVYQTVYRAVPRNGASFGSPFATGAALRTARTPATIAEEHHADFRPWDARGLGLGGWTIDVHHALDVAGNALMLGDGSKRTSTRAAGTIKTIAGTPPPDLCTGLDGALGTTAALINPRQIAVAPDGNVYFADSQCGVRRIDPTGRIFRVAGASSNDASGSGDGGPATAAGLSSPRGVAIAHDGSIYISEFNGHRIRRVAPDGTISRFAGTGTAGTTGDGGPATSAQLRFPSDLALGADGSVYVLQPLNATIRRIAPDGTISTIAGTGSFLDSGDGGPATQAGFNSPSGIAAGPGGSLYIVSASDTVRRISADGTITTYAILGLKGCSFCADERHVTVAPDGLLYVSNIWNVGPPTRAQRFTAVRVEGDGQPKVLAEGPVPAGAPPQLPTDAFFGGDGGPAVGAFYSNPSGIGVGPDGTVYVSDTFNRRVRSITPALTRTTPAGELSLASADGTEISFFDASGRHLRTVDALTGAALWQFAYDGGGRLASITDADGNTTGVERDASGAPLALLAPGGQRTTLTLGGDQMLSAVTNPASEKVELHYSSDGLLLEMKDPKRSAHGFSYDSFGRLSTDSDPAGGGKTLTFTRHGETFRVAITTAMGRNRSYLREKLGSGDVRRTITDAAGLLTVSVTKASGGETVTTPDGTLRQTTLKPDPRLGMQAPFASATSVRLPSGLTLNATQTRTATLTNAADPLTVTTEQSIATINGKSFTSTYTASDRKVLERSPLGRAVSIFLDAKARPARTELPGLTPVTTIYDSRGRMATVVQGPRSMTFSYDDANHLIGITDPLSRSITFTYDAAGRVATQTLPNGHVITFGYDANGNLTSLTPPGRPAHGFTFTLVDLTDTYTPPTVTGGGATHYSYNPDRQLTSITRPDGQTISLGYDTAGRLATLTAPNGVYGYAWSSSTGALSSIAAPDGGALSFTYDGPLVTGVTWSGAVSGSITYGYDSNVRLTSENGVTLGYDDDGLLTSVGALSLSRDAQNGLLTGSVLRGLIDHFSYNTFGEVTHYEATLNGSPVLSFDYTRDNAGRITSKTEALFGSSTSESYTYDAGGHLSDATRPALGTTHYDYDDNGNRLGGTYDAQDRLLSYGDTTYAYTPNGELRTKVTPAGTTTYDYDVLGNLRQVILPNGMTIDYVIDATNRRVGKRVNGTLVRGWLYADSLRIAAEIDGTGVVISRFVYGTRTNVPDYMIRGGVTYRILSDHLGSPHIILDVATGTIVQMLGYDNFGNVLTDTAPAFQPFGFAGGLYDPDTALVRFGARDYDAQAGRWTAKDPIGFGGGDSDLYGYNWSDPVNIVDANGLSGMLTIHSTGEKGSSDNLFSGHSWITYTPDGGTLTSYGTYGNHPEGQVNGLLQDEELRRGYGMGDTTRKTWISDYEERKLQKLIDDYKAKGEKGWSSSNTCSSFASDAWYAATDERLDPNPAGDPWPTPTGLSQSIVDANGRIKHRVLVPGPIHVGVTTP